MHDQRLGPVLCIVRISSVHTINIFYDSLGCSHGLYSGILLLGTVYHKKRHNNDLRDKSSTTLAQIPVSHCLHVLSVEQRCTTGYSMP
jgi:hypothetical protein